MIRDRGEFQTKLERLMEDYKQALKELLLTESSPNLTQTKHIQALALEGCCRKDLENFVLDTYDEAVGDTQVVININRSDITSEDLEHLACLIGVYGEEED